MAGPHSSIATRRAQGQAKCEQLRRGGYLALVQIRADPLVPLRQGSASRSELDRGLIGGPLG